jgi:hypothetical protein
MRSTASGRLALLSHTVPPSSTPRRAQLAHPTKSGDDTVGWNSEGSGSRGQAQWGGVLCQAVPGGLRIEAGTCRVL